MAHFSTVEELKPPTFPQLANINFVKPSEFRSPLIPSATGTAISSLKINISLPFTRPNKDPLYPATHLQLCFQCEGSGSAFLPEVITSRDLNSAADTNLKLYSIELLLLSIPRMKVNHGQTSTAEVIIYAWKREKLLGNWTAGYIEELGVVGLKSTELALLRQKVRNERQKKSIISSGERAKANREGPEEEEEDSRNDGQDDGAA